MKDSTKAVLYAIGFWIMSGLTAFIAQRTPNDTALDYFFGVSALIFGGVAFVCGIVWFLALTEEN